jgi:predicted DNA-binding antitoxin AbrB/MazE fold protein
MTVIRRRLREDVMTQRITAIVEQGRLRPIVPLDLPEGTTVELVIVPAVPPEPPKPQRTPESVRAALAALAAIPMEPGPEFNGQDHNGEADDPLLRLAGTIESDVTDAADRHDQYLGQALADELHGRGNG